MEKHKIYCQIEFLRKFLFQFKKTAPAEDDIMPTNDFLLFSNLAELLQNHSYLILDAPKEEIIALDKNPIFKRMRKKMGNDIMSIPDEYLYMKEDEDFYKRKSSEIFLFDKPEKECSELENKHGLIFISAENIQKSNFFFQSAQIAIDKEGLNFTSMDFVKRFRHPFNAMVVADNFFVKDESILQENIISFCNNILPEKLSENIFQLTFIFQEKNPTFYIFEYQKEISSKLKDIRNYKIDVTLINLKQTASIHDRNIITNYMWINSGYGFNLFKNRRIEKDTTVSFQPITLLDKKFSRYYGSESDERLNCVFEIYYFLQKQFSKAHNSKTEGAVEFAGTRINRLLQN